MAKSEGQQSGHRKGAFDLRELPLASHEAAALYRQVVPPRRRVLGRDGRTRRWRSPGQDLPVETPGSGVGCFGEFVSEDLLKRLVLRDCAEGLSVSGVQAHEAEVRLLSRRLGSHRSLEGLDGLSALPPILVQECELDEESDVKAVQPSRLLSTHLS
jgi:hypothetical protein